MKYLHSMIRVKDLEKTLFFFKDILGLKEVRRKDYDKGQFTLVFLSDGISDCEIELTHNWHSDEEYTGGRNFGHLAFRVDNIYQTCQKLIDHGYVINRPPRDGHMAFVKTPDGISIELLQEGHLEPQEPWASMENIGEW